MSIEVVLTGLGILAVAYVAYFFWVVKYRNGREKTAKLNAIAVLEAADSDNSDK